MRESQRIHNAHNTIIISTYHIYEILVHRHRTARRRRGAWRVVTDTSKDTLATVVREFARPQCMARP